MEEHEIQPLTAISQTPYRAHVPGSKSITNRALLLAAQRPGKTVVKGALHAEDTELLGACLNEFGGLSVVKTDDGFLVERQPGRLEAPDRDLFIGGAGTPARMLLSFAAEAKGVTVISGIPRLCERPMGHLLDALTRLGIRTECLAGPGCLPVRVHGGEPEGVWEIDGSVSSQFLTSLLLFAGRRRDGHPPITVTVPGPLVSRPYVDMTVRQMQIAGIPVRSVGPQAWEVTPKTPTASTLHVEPDASAASYFLAAAAMTGSTVVFEGLGSASSQGDIGFARILEQMGCRVEMSERSIVLTGGPLRGIDVDMELMPDVVLTLAVVAAVAEGPTRITNVANLRVKECDRIKAPVTELRRLGIEAVEGDDWLEIRPGAAIRPARIETYNDHRVAMAFSLLGLRHAGVTILDPACVGKSFPTYWKELERFRAHHNAAA